MYILFSIDILKIFQKDMLYVLDTFIVNFVYHIIQIYHVWEGYLRKIPVERRKVSRAEWRGKFSLKTGIFRKYPSQTWYICLITVEVVKKNVGLANVQ